MSENGYRLLNLARVATLATINPDGTPNLVPVVFALDGDRLVTAVDQKPKRSKNLARLQNIGRDQRVAVLAHHYAEDWARLWWVRADGTASVVTSDPEAISALKSRYPQYAGDVDLSPVISIAIETMRVWTADQG